MTDDLPDPSSGFTSMLRHVAGDIDDRNMSPNNVIAAASHLLREAADRIEADAETIATHKAEADSLYQDGVRLGEQVAALTAERDALRTALEEVKACYVVMRNGDVGYRGDLLNSKPYDIATAALEATTDD